MGKDKALGGRDNKLLALLAIAVCIISIAPIFLHHSHDESTQPHKNVLKGSLDNFVENKKTVTIRKKNDASGTNVAAEQNENIIITKASTEEDSQNNTSPVAKTKSNTSTGGEEGSNNINNSIDAAKSDPQKSNTADKKEEIKNDNNENNKSYLRQKAKPFVGDNSNNTVEHELHPVASLNCADHGGPFDPHIIDEMVYWVRSYSRCKVSVIAVMVFTLKYHTHNVILACNY